MAKLSTEDLLDQFKEMTLIELSEFVKAFEETFDVTVPFNANEPGKSAFDMSSVEAMVRAVEDLVAKAA